MKTLPVVKTRLLVVEDELPIRTLLERALKSRYDIRSAANPTEALKMLEIEVPDKILSDVNMGERMDGLEMAYIIRSRWSTTELYIMCGAFHGTQEKDLSRLLGEGTVRYIPKPFNLTDLYECLNGSISTQPPQSVKNHHK